MPTESHTNIILERFLLLREGSHDKALKLLMDHYGDTMYGIVSHMIKDESAVEDVLQEGFVKVWKNIPHYDPSKSALFTWMNIIIRNTSIDFLRRNSNSKIQNVDFAVFSTVDQIQKENTSDVGLVNQVDKLESKFKQMIDLVYFKGYTQQEIADELNIPLGTVKTRVNLALKSLRKSIFMLLKIFMFIN